MISRACLRLNKMNGSIDKSLYVEEFDLCTQLFAVVLPSVYGTTPLSIFVSQIYPLYFNGSNLSTVQKIVESKSTNPTIWKDLIRCSTESNIKKCQSLIASY